MKWIALLAGALAVFLVGAYLFRSGRTRVVRWYVITTVVLFVIYFMNFAAVLGPQFLPWPKYLLLAFLPGTVILMFWGVERDRNEVLGKPEDREAAIATALVYGAGTGHYTEGGGMGGDAGGP